MSNYAYANNMDDQLRRVGKQTRFTEEHTKSRYERSYQTRQRLHNNIYKLHNKQKQHS